MQKSAVKGEGLKTREEEEKKGNANPTVKIEQKKRNSAEICENVAARKAFSVFLISTIFYKEGEKSGE